MNLATFINRVETITQKNAVKTSSGFALRCPAHQDRTPSLSVSTGRTGCILVKCFSGCTAEDIVSAVGLKMEDLMPDEVHHYSPPPSPQRTAPVQVIRSTRPGDVERLAALRNVAPEAVELAMHRGLVFFGSYHGQRAWFITDGTGVNTQARRMDGQVWREIGSKKAWTLRGSKASWPIGTREAGNYPNLLLVEGGPDLLAAHHFIGIEGRAEDCAAVGILGASNSIPPEALPFFRNKRVRLFPHADREGKIAAYRWYQQLLTVGCTVDSFNCDGLRKTDETPVEDLNDLTSIHSDDFETNRELWSLIP